MSKAEDLSKQYRKFRERCGIKDPVMLDEIEEAYYKGYRQAEEDMDISWVKEVSSVKEMKRAKEEALKAYPPRSIAANYDTINRRDAFEYGYLKAEKDNELTWEDISDIIEIHEDVLEMESCENVYMEVLRRFKEKRNERPV